MATLAEALPRDLPSNPISTSLPQEALVPPSFLTLGMEVPFPCPQTLEVTSMEGHLVGLEKGQYLYGKELVSTGADAASDLKTTHGGSVEACGQETDSVSMFSGWKDCWGMLSFFPLHSYWCLRKLFIPVTMKCGQLNPIPGDC